jgi:benzodiazapine receptor
MKRWISLLLFLTASFAAGFIGSFANARGLPVWFQTLEKPSWNPPSWVFGPVWTSLYLLMGIAAWQVYETDDDNRPRRTALIFFFIQLALNALWSWLFFGWQRPDLAFYEIVVLWICIAVTTRLFFLVRPSAGWMMIPYLAWTTFASILNFAIWQLNR